MNEFESKLVMEITKRKIEHQFETIKHYLQRDCYDDLVDRYYELNLLEEHGKIGLDEYDQFLNLILFNEWQLGEIAEADVNLVAYEHDPEAQEAIWLELTSRITELQKDKE